jgi:methylthioribose-1-phosphate isomerase
VISMNVDGNHYRTIWIEGEKAPRKKEVGSGQLPAECTFKQEHLSVKVIDQRWLPHKFIIEDLKSLKDACTAIKDMHVRGAGLLGAAAGYGMYLAAMEAPKNSFDTYMKKSGQELKATRPTAVNLGRAVDRALASVSKGKSPEEKIQLARKTAQEIADEDAEFCRRIGEHGLPLIEELSGKKGGTVNILTHCNAGWLAFVDYGSATAPIYAAHDKGIKVHVWVDETRPRNQGAMLTAWELGKHGVPHTVIADNTGGHLMQHGMVDMVIVGSDRATRTGDVANKIGTYLKALAAKDNGIPFYAALPSSTFDWSLRDGKKIPIEERGGEEVKFVQGLCNGEIKKILVTPEKSPAANYGFDVTPARLVTGLITERGICRAEEKDILRLYPERK